MNIPASTYYIVCILGLLVGLDLLRRDAKRFK